MNRIILYFEDRPTYRRSLAFLRKSKSFPEYLTSHGSRLITLDFPNEAVLTLQILTLKEVFGNLFYQMTVFDKNNPEGVLHDMTPNQDDEQE